VRSFIGALRGWAELWKCIIITQGRRALGNKKRSLSIVPVDFFPMPVAMLGVVVIPGDGLSEDMTVWGRLQNHVAIGSGHIGDSRPSHMLPMARDHDVVVAVSIMASLEPDRLRG
jgi:hypothetical protein